MPLEFAPVVIFVGRSVATGAELCFATRRVRDVPWMSLYFSVGVWLSLCFVFV